MSRHNAVLAPTKVHHGQREEKKEAATREKPKTAEKGRGPIKGGDFADCLDAKELDGALQCLGDHYISAFEFYYVRTGVKEPETLRKTIIQRARKHQWIIMPTHIRHHWTTALIEAKQESFDVTIYDSAPHPATANDLRKVFATLRLPAPRIVCHARQQRGSNECGLHTILIAIWKWKYSRTLKKRQDETLQIISLKPWRAILLADRKAPEDVTYFLNQAPDAAQIVGCPHKTPKAPPRPPEGGGKSKKSEEAIAISEDEDDAPSKRDEAQDAEVPITRADIEMDRWDQETKRAI